MRLLIFSFIFLFIGCNSKKFLYLDTNVTTVKNSNKIIGVNRVSLPFYMKDLSLMENKNNILVSTSFYFSRDIKKLLISYLSYELNNPYVFDYPFDLDRKPEVLLNIYIDDFYLKEGEIFLKARVLLNKRFLVFSFQEKCKKNYRCVSKILKKFTLNIAKEIK